MLQGKSTTAVLIILGVFLAYEGAALNFGSMPLWKLLLGLGLGSWLIYNGRNIIALLG